MYFSVIIPTYNREKTIERAIDSVLMQDFANFELIIVDDGSTDNSKTIIEKYLQQDHRVKYIYQPNSGSCGAARNCGIKIATGEWLCFLDSDDFWFNGKLSATKQKINSAQPNTVLVGHWETNYVNGDPHKMTEFRTLDPKNQYLDLLFNGNCLSPSAVAIKSSLVKQLNGFSSRKDYFGIEDYDMWLKVAKLGHLELINKSYSGYDISEDNMSHNIESMNTNLLNVIRDHINSLPDNFNKRKLLKIHTARVDYYKGRAYHLNKNFTKSRKCLLKSIVGNPWNMKAWYTFGFTILKIAR